MEYKNIEKKILREECNTKLEMPINCSHESDIGFSVHVCRIILASIGVWPSFNNTTPSKKIINWILQILCQFLLNFLLIPGILFIYFKANNPRQILKMVGPLIYYFMAILKHTILFYSSDQLRDCVKHLEEDWRNVSTTTDRKVMLKNAKVGRNLTIICVCFVYISGYSYRLIVPLLKGTTVNEQNVTIRTFPLPGYYIFFDPQADVVYETIFCLQILSGLATYSSASAVCSVAALSVMHACGQLDILIGKMINLAEREIFMNAETDEKLATVVQHHIRVKRFIKRVEDILQQVCLIEVVGSTLLFCLLGYYIIIEWENSDGVAIMSYSILLITFLFHLFIYCFIGELLTEQGSKVAATLRSLTWYHLPNKTVRCLILVIAMSSFPTRITAGRFMDLSFRSFSAIIRTSVSYLNILRTASI